MLPTNFGAVILLFVLHVLVVNCYSGSSILSKPNGSNRQGRLLGLITDPGLNFYFEYNSCYALAAVISLPLELPSSRSVFFSYNFETNYYYSYFDRQNGLVPLPFTKIIDPDSNAGTILPSLPANGISRQFGEGAELTNEATNRSEEISNDQSSNQTLSTVKSVTLPADAKKAKPSPTKKKLTKAEKAKGRRIRALLENYFMSRRRFFKMIESKMDRSGLKGRDCLLKAICETAADAFGQHNGVIGSVIDVLFLPSASKDEKLPKKYYKAEANGKLRNCNVYNKMCPNGLFDFITKII